MFLQKAVHASRVSSSSLRPVGARFMGGHQNNNHRETAYNRRDMYFDFTPENYKKVENVLGKYPGNYKRSGIIPLLDLAQRQHGGWLPYAAMRKVADIVECPEMEVIEVATFYTMFYREPQGKYLLQLCGTTPCMICGAQDIKKTIENHLGIHDGETTADGLFTLVEVECLGACANAPMIQMNDDFYENLTPATTIELIEACKKGTPPLMNKWGSLPMNGQLSCEGPLGRTTLDVIPGAGHMMRTDLEPKVDPSTVKEHMGY